MTKLTIDTNEFCGFIRGGLDEYGGDPDYASIVAYIDSKLAEAYEAGKKDAIHVIQTYQIPVGHSAAGEMAAEWTLDALREIREEIKALPKEPTCEK